MTLRAAAAIAILVVSVGASCTRSVGPTEDRALVGVWSIDDASLEVIRQLGFARAEAGDHRIELRSDRTCEFRSYWLLEMDAGGRAREDNYVLDSQSCRWTAVERRRRWPGGRDIIGGVELDLTRQSGGETRYTSVDLDVEQAGDAIILANGFGDPDRDRALTFSRRQ